MVVICGHLGSLQRSLRGRRLKGKGKGVLGKGVLDARETRGAREEGGRETSLPPLPSLLERPSRFAFCVSPFPFPFKRLPRRLPPPQAFLMELVFHPSQHLFVGRDEIHEKRALEKRLAPW